jgi:hypothetical protein
MIIFGYNARKTHYFVAGFPAAFFMNNQKLNNYNEAYITLELHINIFMSHIWETRNQPNPLNYFVSYLLFKESHNATCD